MLKIRTLIVDDEPLARERILHFLKKDSEFEVVGECGSGRDAVASIQTLRPDLVFLDVQMPRVDGFDVLRQIEPDRMPAVIFVTAYDQYAVKAFEVHAMDYLLKPFRRKRFEEALNRFKHEFSREQPDAGMIAKRALALLEDLNRERSYVNRLLVPKEGGSLFVQVKEVDWFQAEDNYVRLHLGGKSYLIRESLKNLEDQLDPRQFLRIHRRAIVNLDRIQEVQPWFHRTCRIRLKDGTILPVSRRFKHKLRTD